MEIERALVKQPPSRLICTICQEIFTNPVHVIPCCHCFCENCISSWNHSSNTCPVCRETLHEEDGEFVLKKAILVSELLEEVEVRCKFGVKCTVTCQSFGVLGSEFEEVPDGCTVQMPLKNIKSHEEKCPYGKETLIKKLEDEIAVLHVVNVRNKQKVVYLKAEVDELTESLNSMSIAAQYYKAKFHETKLEPYDSFRYQIGDALIFSRVLSYHMFDGSELDLPKCFVALQRLAAEWQRRSAVQIVTTPISEAEGMKLLFYTAAACNFWTPKQQARLEEWKDYF